MPTGNGSATDNSFIAINSNTVEGVQVFGDAIAQGNIVEWGVNQKQGLNPTLYFKYVKKKLKPLQRKRFESRMKKIEKAFDKAVSNGQYALGEKMLNSLSKDIKEAELYSLGIRYQIEKDVIWKHKHNIRGGHISDTKLHEFTRAIPKNVLKEKAKYDGVFDEYVILHYWNQEVEDQKKGGQKMSKEEYEKMKDPVLFGVLKETPGVWYYIADWEDEYCDLTFDELIDHIGLDDEEVSLSKQPYRVSSLTEDISDSQ